jgi:hypothetical protein
MNENDIKKSEMRQFLNEAMRRVAKDKAYIHQAKEVSNLAGKIIKMELGDVQVCAMNKTAVASPFWDNK